MIRKIIYIIIFNILGYVFKKSKSYKYTRTSIEILISELIKSLCKNKFEEQNMISGIQAYLVEK